MLIKVGFSTSRGLISRMVRFFTKSKISHTFFIIEDTFAGMDMVLEASYSGYHLTTLHQFEKNNKVLAVIPLSYDISKELKKSLRFLGRSYDYLGVIGVLLVLLGRLAKLKLPNPFNTKALFCSEAIVNVLKNSNYPNADTLTSSTVTPQNLYDFLKEEAV